MRLRYLLAARAPPTTRRKKLRRHFFAADPITAKHKDTYEKPTRQEISRVRAGDYVLLISGDGRTDDLMFDVTNGILLTGDSTMHVHRLQVARLPEVNLARFRSRLLPTADWRL